MDGDTSNEARMPPKLFSFTHFTRNASANPLESHTFKTKNLKPFRFTHLQKSGGGTPHTGGRGVATIQPRTSNLRSLPCAVLADSFRLHASNRRIQQFHHVQDGQRAPVTLQPRGNLQQATGIAGNHRIGVCRRAVLCFAVAQLLRGSGRDQVVDTRGAAANSRSAISTTSSWGIVASALRGCARTPCACCRWQAS